MAIGNGMKKEIWTNFQQRFRVPTICEFYGSTEGNANLVCFFKILFFSFFF